MNIWNFLEKKLDQDNTLYLMVVTESKGSSPGKQGFSMAVCSDNSLFGSIGGGTMEFNLVEECKENLKRRELRFYSKAQKHEGDKADSTGMICSGKQTVAFIPLTKEDKQYISDISSCLNSNCTGLLEITEKDFCFHKTKKSIDLKYQFDVYDKGNWKYQEVVGYKNTLYVIGAGHVGYAVSRLFSQLGFNVIVYDNRSDLDMLDNNQYANEKKVIDYKIVDQFVCEGNNKFVVIMTNNHQHDIDVLSKLIPKNLAYLGLMGSKSKVAKFKKSLKKMGFGDSDLTRIHAPIGLQINSITPDEIAISIAAEIIKVKNN